MEAHMKENSLPVRINILVQNFLGSLEAPAQPLRRAQPGREGPKAIRVERPKRREFYYYKQLIDLDTRTLVGHMSDISVGGFKIDCINPIPVNKEFRLLINLTSEVADKPHMSFVARSRWCAVDPLDPYVYNVGFQLQNIAPDDFEIFNRMLEKYGRDVDRRVANLRRSNKW
jgi:hypothetical protein